MNAADVRTSVIKTINDAPVRSKVGEFVLQFFVDGVYNATWDYQGKAGDIISAARDFETISSKPVEFEVYNLPNN